MRSSDILAPLFFAASTLAQGPPEGIAPSSQPPAGCEPNSNGNFTIGTLKLANSKVQKRESAVEVSPFFTSPVITTPWHTHTDISQAADGALVCNLNKGILRDRDGRTGSVVSNRQFQFDGPPQAGAIYTGGFSICNNGSLAIGGSTRWWQCSSGGFYNLYDEWIGAQCEEIRIQVAMSGPPAAAVVPSKSVNTATSSAAAVSTEVASVQSSLATISGAVSTVSKSAIGPSASFTASSGNMSSTTGPTRLAGPSSSSTGLSATGTARPSTSPTGAADAPPAGGAASSSFGIARGSMLGAFVVIFGAALVL